jgi:Sec-independent protein translocase protein TatA
VSALGLLDVGPIEMLVLAVAAIMLFGGDLPDLARRAGQIVGRLRAAAHELTSQIDPPADLLRLPDPDDAMHNPPPSTPSLPPTTRYPTSPPSTPPQPATPASPAAPPEDPPPPPT